jgi:hypothetical protein
MKNESPLLVNVYSYFSYISDPNNVDLSFALCNSQTVTVRDGKYVYRNLFDASLGAIYAALAKIGGANLEVVVSESGWPSKGGVAATVENAEIFYDNLIKHVSSGTPNRPNQALETYLFAMFDENQKGPAETERHFGLFTPDKQPKYQITQMHGSSNSTSSSPHSGSSSSFQSGQGDILHIVFFYSSIWRSGNLFLHFFIIYFLYLISKHYFFIKVKHLSHGVFFFYASWCNI